MILAEEEAGAMEMDVGHVQSHRAARGNVPGFIEVRLGSCVIALEAKTKRTGQQRQWDVVLLAGALESFHSSRKFV